MAMDQLSTLSHVYEHCAVLLFLMEIAGALSCLLNLLDAKIILSEVYTYMDDFIKEEMALEIKPFRHYDLLLYYFQQCSIYFVIFVINVSDKKTEIAGSDNFMTVSRQGMCAFSVSREIDLSSKS